MKKICIFFSLFLTSKGICQPYTFSTSTAAYTALTGATSANGSTVWSYATSFTVPIGFTFNFMGNNYTSLYVEGGGFTFFDLSYNYLLLPFGVALKDKGTSSSLSPISYKTEGSSPNRILKIEWSNADYFNNAGSTANFQLWLYETTNVIETHVGICTVSNPALAYSWNSDTGPSIGIYEYSGSTLLYGFGLSGAAVAPTENNNLSGAGINPFDYSLNGTPSPNTVYRFEPAATGIHAYQQINDALFYMDHSQGKLIYSSSTVVESICVFDMAGQLIYGDKPGNLSGVIDCSFAGQKGIYLLTIRLSGGTFLNRKISL
ncbi:MAG TPA: hypothetical protein VD905_19870 [Flavobacteriales bacterium]|nr:hypothetical protein [Flavobacteriales bacterium]